MKESINWAVIRQTDGESWIDISSLSRDREHCKQRARRLNFQLPQWAKDNPIEGIAKVEVKLLNP